jgi:hypothetical protein
MRDTLILKRKLKYLNNTLDLEDVYYWRNATAGLT